MKYHTSVLLQESINGLNIQPNGLYVDCTFGGGGHSSLILQNITNGKLFAFDQDADAKKNAIKDSRFILIESNFRFLKRNLKLNDVISIDGILADLGVSSHQFDTAERGFSFRFNAELDMRMNQRQTIKAKDILNTYTEHELHELFQNYGEVINSKSLAAHIVLKRNEKKFETTHDFVESIKHLVRGKYQEQYLAQVFQALRIEVNDEINALKEMLRQSYEILKPKGRICVITFHSLEDRIVKHFLKYGNFDGTHEKDDFGNIKKYFTLINKKPITAESLELKENNRARSAKLRIAEKI